MCCTFSYRRREERLSPSTRGEDIASGTYGHSPEGYIGFKYSANLYGVGRSAQVIQVYRLCTCKLLPRSISLRSMSIYGNQSIIEEVIPIV
jgi:predicted DNA-binding transcriptional regulator AlpA